MRKILITLSLLMPVMANAQACFPDSKLISVEHIGEDFMEGRDNVIKGDWRAIWCPTGVFNGPDMSYTLYTHVVLDKYKVLDFSTAMEMLKSILAATDPIATLSATLKSKEIIPPPGSLERFQYETLLQIACQQAVNVRKQRYPNIQVNCKSPTPLPITKWTVAPFTSGERPSRIVVDGKLVIQSSPVYQPVGKECNPNILPVFTTSSGSWMAVNNQPTNLRWLCRS